MSATAPSAHPNGASNADAPGGGRFRGFLSMQARGVIALPPLLRRRYGLDRPGAQVEIVEREDGVLEVRPTAAVPADQAWFWSERWQEGEHDVEEHLRRGEVAHHDSPDAFIAHLNELDEQAQLNTAQHAEGPSPA